VKSNEEMTKKEKSKCGKLNRFILVEVWNHSAFLIKADRGHNCGREEANLNNYSLVVPGNSSL
jgi:hypothetical protein